MCARIGAPSLASLARVLNYWILAPLHILPYTYSSLHSAYMRSHGVDLARSVSELLGPSSFTHSALYTVHIGHSGWEILWGGKCPEQEMSPARPTLGQSIILTAFDELQSPCVGFTGVGRANSCCSFSTILNNFGDSLAKGHWGAKSGKKWLKS